MWVCTDCARSHTAAYPLNVLGLPPERVLFVAGSRRNIPGAGGVGIDVWWHNRMGMPMSVAMEKSPVMAGCRSRWWPSESPRPSLVVSIRELGPGR
jgi:FMN phosphatase YigB (HAD superfamily)